MRITWLAVIFLCLATAVSAAVHPEAANVLILVNDAVPPQAGTGGKGASTFIGEYYAQQRGVPLSQILHLNVPLGCCDNNPADWDSWNASWEKFDTTIRQPLKKFLADNHLTNQINYIVPVYGIPLRTGPDGLSLDSFLATINSGQDSQWLYNPYYTTWNQSQPHIRNFQNPTGWKVYIVTRLDGPTMNVALGLIDKAIRAEDALKTTDGIAYFDYRHIAPGSGGYYVADQTVVNANNLARSLGYETVFNDQLVSGNMIHSAPKALWAWGWYSGPFTWDGYEFVEGAVGAQLTSYTANSIRTMLPGGWVPLWLNAGITATWGATTEPYTSGYANGDSLFNKFWSGYNFGESAYQATPWLNHAMVFVGDPLYAPKVFRSGNVSITSLACQATTLAANASTPCTVTLSKAAATNTTIDLSSSVPVVSVPASITVPVNSTSTAFTATTGAFAVAQSATLRATLNGTTVSAPISLAAPLAVASLVCQATSLAANASTTCTVTLSRAAATDTAVNLSSSSPLLTVPPSVIVPANSTSIFFAVAAGAITADQSATVSATLNGTTASAPLSLVAPLRIASLTCQAASLAPRASTSCTVSLSRTAALDTAISLVSDCAALSVPSHVTVPAGAASAPFTASVIIAPYPTTVATITSDLSGTGARTKITVAGSGGAATFVKTDTTTLGSWKGVYGGDGYSVINNATSLPAYVTMAPSGNAAWTWASSTGDTRALQKPALPTDRIAACWYSSGAFSFVLNFTDQATHQVALYLLDWEALGRVDRVEIFDSSNNLLDTRTVANFGGGQYLVWDLNGTVTVRITSAGQMNAVLSGIFFGGKPSTTATGTASFLRTDTTTSGSWKNAYGAEGYSIVGDVVSLPSFATLTPSGNTVSTWASSTTDVRGLQKSSVSGDRVAASWIAANSFSLDLRFTDQATHQVALYLVDWERFGRSNRVDIYDANNTLLDSRTASGFDGGQYWVWNLSGRVTVRITTLGPSSAVLSGVFFGGKPAVSAGSGSIAFLRSDTTTQGSWKGVYGADGYTVVNGSASTPIYVNVTPSGNSAWTWTPSTSDLRALQKPPSTTDRIAACWYSAGAVSLDVQFTDQVSHQVALYFVDWDRFRRSSRVDILDANNNIVDTRIVANFGEGQYLVWNLSGHVTIRITNTGPLNAVLSGIFFR